MTSVVPTGYTSVAPWIVTPDTGQFLDFVTAVFEGVELGRVKLEDGTVGHAEFRVGDTVLLAFDQRPGWPAMPSLLRIFVADADATIGRAVAAGARGHVTRAPGGRPAGRAGNRWVRQHLVDQHAGRRCRPRRGDAAPCRATVRRGDERRAGVPRPRTARPHRRSR